MVQANSTPRPGTVKMAGPPTAGSRW